MNAFQQRAFRCVERAARALSEDAAPTIEHLLSKHGISRELFAMAKQAVREQARVVVHFHPDRIGRNGISVAASLLETGLLGNQFETGISSGSLTPFAGGPRDTWEKNLFDGAYQDQGIQAVDRPKYGALDLMGFSDGAAPRFGSCYFRLAKSVSGRCSFTDKDSYLEPTIFGTSEQFDAILAELMRRSESEGSILGFEHSGLETLLTRLSAISDSRVGFAANYGRTLDDYIEAQIHGTIHLGNDVERLVGDPSFLGTETGDAMTAVCAKFGIELDWHGGFMVHCDEVPSEFRGPRMPVLARRVAENGWLNASILGKAAVSLARQPESWLDWGPYPETLQNIKQLWHVLVHCGKPIRPGNS